MWWPGTELNVSGARGMCKLQMLWRQVWIQPYHRDGIAFQNGVKDDSRTFTSEWQGAGCHLVKQDSKGEQVVACVQLPGPHLLGRHVGYCAKNTAGTCQVRRTSHDARPKREPS